MQNGIRIQPDVSAIATRSNNLFGFIAWHYHDDDLPGAAAAVTLDLADFDTKAKTVHHYRINKSHSNACTMWLAPGSPQDPTDAQVAEMKTVGGLTEMSPAPESQSQDGGTRLRLSLPRQAVPLIVFG